MPSFPVDSGTWAGKTRLFRADQIVVRIRTNPQVSALDLTARNADLFADVLATIPGSRLKGYVGPFGVIALPSQIPALDALAALEARTGAATGVEFAEPDFLMVGTTAPVPLWPYDRFLQAPVDYYSWQWGMKDIGMDHAWAVQQGNDGVFIAVIDSGVASHLDLEGARLWYGGDYLDEYEITGIFSTTEGDKVADLNGHGLAMTGIVGAKPQLVPPGTPDLSGCCGMNWASPIGICRSLDDSKNGTVSSVYGGVMQSLLWGKDEGMRVVANLSVILSDSGGGSLTLESLCDVVKAENALLVCGTGDLSIGAPASYASDAAYAENVVAVGYTQNLTGVEEPATGSPEGPTVVAPGRDLTVLDFWDS
ncbi:MAG: S8 family serine peptidase, partial [Gemmatimonadetes bacterium]|nr:S8 family serine peptidase [Gemmatimonadota bacterium]